MKIINIALMLTVLVVAQITPRIARSEGAAALSTVRSIVFPVLGDTRFGDDFGDPRSGGRTHEGNDIIAKKHQPVLSAVDGYIRYVTYPEASYGYSVGLIDTEGYRYNYLHINNDSIGTDDGKGGATLAFAPGVFRGAPVVRGQLLGWVGDSGNAEHTVSHLHFEIRDQDGSALNPFPSLTQATHFTKAVAAPILPNEILPYGQFKGGAHVAIGNVDVSDPQPEIITAPGPGGGPVLRVYGSLSHQLVSQFFAYGKDMRSGVDVTAADTDGDGVDEIITSPGSGTTPEIRVFNFDGTLRTSFMAYGQTFKGGVHVAAADLDGNGTAEIITGAGRGGGPHVKVFNGNGERVSQFFAYSTSFRGGVDVAAYPAVGVVPGGIITAPGRGGGPHVKIFDNSGVLTTQFFADDKSFRGGTRVAIGDVYPQLPGLEILAVAESGGSPHAHLFAFDGTEYGFFEEFEEWWTGGYDIAASTNTAVISSTVGGRRASVRLLVP